MERFHNKWVIAKHAPSGWSLLAQRFFPPFQDNFQASKTTFKPSRQAFTIPAPSPTPRILSRSILETREGSNMLSAGKSKSRENIGIQIYRKVDKEKVGKTKKVIEVSRPHFPLSTTEGKTVQKLSENKWETTNESGWEEKTDYRFEFQ